MSLCPQSIVVPTLLSTAAPPGPRRRRAGVAPRPGSARGRRFATALLRAVAGMMVAVGLGAAASVPAAALAGEPAGDVLQPLRPDTVRTNLWLCEALMREAVQPALEVLPPPPAAVRLAAMRLDAAAPAQSGGGRGAASGGGARASAETYEVLEQVATRELRERGYDVYLASEPAAADSGDVASDEPVPPAVAVGYELALRVVGLDVGYPATGRRLGLWREWVARRVDLTVAARVTEVPDGRVLFNERVVRRFRDRIQDDDVPVVESGPYRFTRAELRDSGWQRRIEEIMVLGTLAGLVAVYFANTQ
ncbi:MAG: hypothetical protein R6X25_00390 [Candidatus Krumholzibacteriia bacterium]